MRFALTRCSKSVENTKCPFLFKASSSSQKGCYFFFRFFSKGVLRLHVRWSLFSISQHLKEEEKSLPAKSLSHLSMSLFPISRKSDEYEFFVD
jgi:hypothetical protein